MIRRFQTLIVWDLMLLDLLLRIVFQIILLLFYVINGTAFIKFLGDLDVPERQLLLDFKRIILVDEILEVIVKQIFRNKQCLCYWYGLMLKYHVFITICLCLLLTTVLL